MSKRITNNSASMFRCKLVSKVKNDDTKKRHPDFSPNVSLSMVMMDYLKRYDMNSLRQRRHVSHS
jgi:hypothetical protein